jgi:hypothetical protein
VKTSAGREEKEVFAAYITKNRLKRSGQRDVILTPPRSARHLRGRPPPARAEAAPDIGRTTVYRR